MAAITTATKTTATAPVRGTKRSYYQATINYTVITGTAAQTDETTITLPAPIEGGSIQLTNLALGGATDYTVKLFTAESWASSGTKAAYATTGVVTADVIRGYNGVAITTANASGISIPGGAHICQLVLSTGNPTNGTLTITLQFSLLD